MRALTEDSREDEETLYLCTYSYTLWLHAYAKNGNPFVVQECRTSRQGLLAVLAEEPGKDRRRVSSYAAYCAYEKQASVGE